MYHGRKVLNLVGINPSSWNIGLVMAMATHERLNIWECDRCIHIYGFI